MRVLFHPEFPQNVRRFADAYGEISPGLSIRFQQEVEAAIEAIKRSPSGAGHFLNLGSEVVPELRRWNLRSFPFYILHGSSHELLIFGSVIPSRSGPLTWLKRFPSGQWPKARSIA